MAMDQDDVDLLIVMGSSLKVGPVNDIPDAIDESVPRILSKFFMEVLRTVRDHNSCSGYFTWKLLFISISIANYP